MQQRYYLLGAVVLAALLVPVFLQYQAPSLAEIEPVEPIPEDPITLDKLREQLAEKISRANIVIITCDARWNGMIKYQTIQGTEIQYISGTGDKTIDVQGDLLYITVERWYAPPEAAKYIGLEVRVNGEIKYKEANGDYHSWKK